MNKTAVAIAVLAIGLIVLAGGLTLRHDFPAAQDGAQDAAQETATQNAQTIGIGGPFTLLDGEGRTVTNQTFHGKWMLIYFGYTHCPDACPTALSNMAVALRKLGPKADRIVPVFITVDPERDTPKVMHDYVQSFGPQFVGLTGTQEQIAATEHGYRVYSAKHETQNGNYDMDHSSIIYVMDPDGHFVGDFTHESDPAKMTQQLDRMIS